VSIGRGSGKLEPSITQGSGTDIRLPERICYTRSYLLYWRHMYEMERAMVC